MAYHKEKKKNPQYEETEKASNQTQIWQECWNYQTRNLK